MRTTAFNFKVARAGWPGNTQVAALTEPGKKREPQRERERGMDEEEENVNLTL